MTTNSIESTNVEAQEMETQNAQGQNDNQPMVIPVIHEQVTFDKQVVESGKVKISKRTVEHDELIDIPLLREEVAIEHVPINQYVDTAPQMRQEGNTMIIPVVQEQVFYQKRLLLVEELHVRKQIVEEHKPQQISLLKEEVEVTRYTENDNPNKGI